MSFLDRLKEKPEEAAVETLPQPEGITTPDSTFRITLELQDSLGSLSAAAGEVAKRAGYPDNQPASLDYWLEQFEFLAARAIGKSEALRQVRATDEMGEDKL